MMRLAGLPFRCSAALLVSACALAADAGGAERLLMRGHADEAIALLKSAPDGPSHLLLCRAYYSEELLDDAVSACEAAVAAMPHSSAAEDWLGRAYGRKADQYGPISGLTYARRVRAAFEAAVALDAHDKDAVNDLGEYYAKAPSVAGGGADRADALADRVSAFLPQAAHRSRAMAAEHADDFAGAEREWRAAVGVAGRADAWADLGDFYGRRKDYGRSLDALQHAVSVDRAAGPVWVDAAGTLIETKQHPELAEQWLRRYIAGNAQSDAAPVCRAMTELGKLLAKRGDKDGARAEFQQALALASGYAPAQKALHSL